MGKSLELDRLLDSDSLSFSQRMFVRSLVSYEIVRDIRKEVLIRYYPKDNQLTLTYYPNLGDPMVRENTYKHVMYSLIEQNYGFGKCLELSEEVRNFLIDNMGNHKTEQPLNAKSQEIYSLLERVLAYEK
jgi:hypothetical protein